LRHSQYSKKTANTMLAARKIKILLSILAILTLAAGYAVVRLSNVERALLPAQHSFYPWHVSIGTDAHEGGASSIDIRDATYNVSFDFSLSKEPQYPYVTLGLTFDDAAHPEKLLDWLEYSSILLRVKCRPDNILSFVLYSYEEQLTKFSDITTFRPAITFFSCNQEWQDVRVNLHKLDTPEWWLRQHNLNLSHRDYHLNQVRGFSIASSIESPVDTQSGVTIEAITLEGRNWSLIYVAIALGVVIWVGISYWCFAAFFSMRKNTLLPHSIAPLAYQQITTEPKYERDKSKVLDYLASAYSNPQLSVDTSVDTLGINRAKINDILREATGLTFTGYLNKLRLTEATRLLSEKHMGVAETAFAVGYGSISYFNRVFKKEYGCAPSSYKNSVVTDTNSNPTA
jgi:AraC-like DNA-binding protein